LGLRDVRAVFDAASRKDHLPQEAERQNGAVFGTMQRPQNLARVVPAEDEISKEVKRSQAPLADVARAWAFKHRKALADVPSRIAHEDQGSTMRSRLSCPIRRRSLLPRVTCGRSGFSRAFGAVTAT